MEEITGTVERFSIVPHRIDLKVAFLLVGDTEVTIAEVAGFHNDSFIAKLVLTQPGDTVTFKKLTDFTTKVYDFVNDTLACRL